MSRRDDAVTLRQMLDMGREILSLTRGRSAADLRSNRLLELAVSRLLEVLGEAARRVSAGFREAHPELPWTQMIGMRNVLIHAYDDVDLATVWTTIQDDIPRLVQALERLVR